LTPSTHAVYTVLAGIFATMRGLLASGGKHSIRYAAPLALHKALQP